ncbi:hypothetical protein NWF24_13580 [Variovorax paradoxus]|uniref:hypothetical protein n=1 Tax=Variovorax paradoxus TaxID=34073 RepID=UPI0021AC6ADA|nr:hypothetical protein [Variovorax paradoxus]UVH60393.1 hypothetical protein NWF24_13580 [Variovorax paradoxus]
MKCTIRAFLVIATTLTGCSAMACKPVVVTRLTFAEGAADLEPAQIAKLVEFIDRANSAFPKYLEVSIDGGATVKVPGRTPAQARQLARRRAENVTRAYKQLQPTEIKLETTSSIYEDNKMSREASNDFVVVQFHPDYEALKLPDCNPVPIPGFKR